MQSIGGASGDMFLAALLDAGLSQEALLEELAKLPATGFQLQASRQVRGGLEGTHLKVILDDPRPGTLSPDDLLRLVAQSRLSDALKARAAQVLQRLIQAEERVHGGAGALHELGTLDTLIDVVGVVAGLDRLGVEQVYASPLLTGSGTVATAHGLLPVPAPATLALLAQAGAPTLPPPLEATGELTTPTGAALLTTLASFHPPTLAIQRIGYGLGTRDTPGRPNALAIWLAETPQETEPLVLLETNIDDLSPELLAYAQEQLMAHGARDAWFTSIGMKKSRPAVLLSVLCPAAAEGRMVEILFRETSTLGVRVRPVRRYEAQREVRQITTPLGSVPVKLKLWQGKVLSVAPEYEVCRRLALEHLLPLPEVYRRIQEEAARQFLPR